MSKRVLSLAMVLVLAVSMGLPAFAQEVTPMEVPTDVGITAISAALPIESLPDIKAPLTYSDGRVPHDAGGRVPALLYPESYSDGGAGIRVFGGTFAIPVGETVALRLPQRGLTLNDAIPVGFTVMGGAEFINYDDNSMFRDGQTWRTPSWEIRRRDADNVPYIDFFVTGVADGTVELVTRTPGTTGLSVYRIAVGNGGAHEMMPAQVRAVRDRVTALAGQHARRLDGEWGDMHAAMMASGEKEGHEHFARMTAALDEIRRSSGARYVYAFYPAGPVHNSEFFITVDGSAEPDDFGTAWPFEIQYLEAWNGRAAAARSAWEDGSSFCWTAFAPIHNSQGNVVALLGIDYPAPIIASFPAWNRDSEHWNGLIK